MYICTLLTGKHCCLWCLATQADLKTPLEQRGRLQTRSIQSLRDDHQRFRDSGGNLRHAKLFNNSIGQPIFDIPLEKVKTDSNIIHTCTCKCTYTTGLHTWTPYKPRDFQQAIQPARECLSRAGFAPGREEYRRESGGNIIWEVFGCTKEAVRASEVA